MITRIRTTLISVHEMILGLRCAAASDVGKEICVLA
jgi:hypothetical protein